MNLFAILGGGFFVESNGVWFIRGIFSAFIIDEDGNCDASKYGVYTKVNAFADWINDIMKKYPSSVSSSINSTVTNAVRIAAPQLMHSLSTSLHCSYVTMKVVHRPAEGNV